MTISEDSVRVLVILPREYLSTIDSLKSPILRSRSAVIRRIVEEAVEGPFVLPQRSANKTITASCDQEAA